MTVIDELPRMALYADVLRALSRREARSGQRVSGDVAASEESTLGALRALRGLGLVHGVHPPGHAMVMYWQQTELGEVVASLLDAARIDAAIEAQDERR